MNDNEVKRSYNCCLSLWCLFCLKILTVCIPRRFVCFEALWTNLVGAGATFHSYEQWIALCNSCKTSKAQPIESESTCWVFLLFCLWTCSVLVCPSLFLQLKIAVFTFSPNATVIVSPFSLACELLEPTISPSCFFLCKIKSVGGFSTNLVTGLQIRKTKTSSYIKEITNPPVERNTLRAPRKGARQFQINQNISRAECMQIEDSRGDTHKRVRHQKDQVLT